MKIVKEFFPEKIESLEILKDKFEAFKKFPQKYEMAILTALSYFPELTNEKITFIEKKSLLAFSSRPSLSSLFKRKKEYLIILSTESKKVPPHLLFSSLSLNKQIGILGHELSHTIFYLNKSKIEILLIGLRYLFVNYRIKFERETDLETIKRGLGFQLLDFALYCRNHLKAPEKYKKWLNKFYLKPLEIKEFMQQIPEYDL